MSMAETRMDGQHSILPHLKDIQKLVKAGADVNAMNENQYYLRLKLIILLAIPLWKKDRPRLGLNQQMKTLLP
jgi:hypothetical protein